MPARKIATRLIRWFLLIALLPLLITYGFSFSFAREHLRKEVLTNLQYIAGYKANELESYARERIQSVKALARAPGVARALYSMRWVTEKQGVNTLAYNFIDKAYRQYLTYIKEDALYEDLYLITANGDIVFSVNRDRDLGSNLFSSSYKHTQLAKAVEMALTLQQTEVSDFKHYAPINKTAAFIAAPIFFKGEVLGTVALRISNEQVFGIVNSYLGLGESGETIAIQNHNGSSFYAAPLRFDRQQAFLRSLEIDSNTSKLLENAIGRTLEDGIGKDYRDKSVIAYYRYVPSLRWDLIVKMDVEESFASIKELLQSFIIIGLLTVVFVVAATFPVASGITVPIRKLTTTTREFSNNNWQVRAEIDSEDEIGELAKGFNTMADSIQGANNQLAKYSHSLELRSAELNETLQALANSNQIKQDFLCAITHELRTPLNGILGSLELLPDLINDEDRNILDLAKESASTLMHIVDDILLFSKIQAENLQAHSNAFNLHALLHSLAQHYTHQTENKGIAFHMSRQDEVPEELVGDAYLLEVVLNHVLQNAIKFTSEGRISFVISLASKQPDDDHINIQFVISDTGIGISKKDQEMIFEIFQQVTSGFRRAFGGAGIGLTICRKVIILMAGEISLSSDIGRGTQITLCIPFRRAAPQTEVSPKREDSAPESSHTTAGKRRILIVEDNKANHIIQQRMMMKLGYGISIAENGEEAVAIAERENFSAILMDLQMPVMDGFEATKKIRASIGDNRSIPIIALTANDGDDVRNQCLDIGMNDYLVKPVKIRRLEECLNHWLK